MDDYQKPQVSPRWLALKSRKNRCSVTLYASVHMEEKKMIVYSFVKQPLQKPLALNSSKLRLKNLCIFKHWVEVL